MLKFVFPIFIIVRKLSPFIFNEVCEFYNFYALNYIIPQYLLSHIMLFLSEGLQSEARTAAAVVLHFERDLAEPRNIESPVIRLRYQQAKIEVQKFDLAQPGITVVPQPNYLFYPPLLPSTLVSSLEESRRVYSMTVLFHIENPHCFSICCC